MTALHPLLISLDGSIKQLTAENAATQMKDIDAKARALGKQMETSGAALEKSPPLKGITDAIGLLSPGRQAITLVNQTVQDVIAKKEIIKTSGQADAFGSALKSFKAGFLVLNKAFLTQIPASMKSQIPQGTTLPSDEQMGKLLDGAVDQLVAIFKGEQTGFILPTGMAGMPGMPKMTPGSGQPAAPTSQAGGMGGMAGMSGMGNMPSMPKATGAAKGIPKGAPKATPKMGGMPAKGNGLYIESWA
jgi:hypothetical protein